MEKIKQRVRITLVNWRNVRKNAKENWWVCDHMTQSVFLNPRVDFRVDEMVTIILFFKKSLWLKGNGSVTVSVKCGHRRNAQHRP